MVFPAMVRVLSPQNGGATDRICYYAYAVHDPLRRFIADTFQALAPSTRIALVQLVGNRELSAGHLVEGLGIEQAYGSERRAGLRAKQLATGRARGSQAFYSSLYHLHLEVLAGMWMRRYFDQAETQALEGFNALDDEPRRKAK